MLVPGWYRTLITLTTQAQGGAVRVSTLPTADGQEPRFRKDDPGDMVPVWSGLLSGGPCPGSRGTWSFTLSPLPLQRLRLRDHMWAPRPWLSRGGSGGILAGSPETIHPAQGSGRADPALPLQRVSGHRRQSL